MKVIKIIFILPALFISNLVLSQHKPDITFKEYTTSGEYVVKGAGFYVDEEYEKAIEQFELINESDTNYSESLADKAVSYIKLEAYEKAENVSREGLKRTTEDRHYHYRNLASALDGQKKYEESIAVLDKGLEEFPYNMHMRYAKVLYLDHADQDKACADLLKLQLQEHHNFATFHLKAGLLAYHEKEITKTMMAYGFYLILTPGSAGANNVLYHLNEAVRSKADDAEPQGFKFSESGDDFSDIDLLINNYAALSSKYKVPSKVDLPLIKQFYLMMNKLEYDKNDKGFFMQYYVPIYKKILKEDKFKDFSYYLLLSSQNASHLAQANKHLSDLKEFKTWFQNALEDQLGKHTAILDGKEQEVQYWYKGDGTLEAIGNLNSAQKPIGEFKFYHENGALSSVGKFDDQGVKTGVWTSYYENSNIKEEATLKSGKLNGPYNYYHDNGNLSYEVVYKDGKAQGLVSYYNILGNKYRESNFKDDQLNGLTTFYHENGNVSQTI